ncbi:integrin alpha-L-like [Corvus kubaryi]|uniref:integrin alpha-L-like n=1 Tax=Corvus kubaryi TaxID=68294 RepID=UPI001C05CC27|nr:integrin alpha-L-like [Corvus kubaryi]
MTPCARRWPPQPHVQHPRRSVQADAVLRAAGGARPAARRVLVLITDGDATDSDTESSVRAAEERGIHRYVIGVGNNFNTPNTQLYLQQFASGPSFVQVLKSFEQLQSLFQELQARLYDIEGTTQLHSFHLEMCSSGISVDVIQVGRGRGG